MKSKYYSLKNILSKNARYNLIIGERSNGKTFAVLEHMLKTYCETGKQGAIIRRWRTDFESQRAKNIWGGIIENHLVSKYSGGKWDTVIYYQAAWYLATYDDENDRYIKDETPIAYRFSLNEMEHDKSTSYPNVTVVLFDEFTTRGYYLVDEFVTFMNVLSTIIRDRNDVIIFMCGNTVNKYSPYYSEFGLTNIKQMKKGDIDVYTYGDSGLRLAVEYSDSPSKKKLSDVYFAFNNPKLNMITNGDWEMEIYPHLPYKYLPKEVCFMFFIQFDNEILQCEIITRNNDLFVYVHRKTSELKKKSTDIIYNLSSSPQFNIRYSFIRPIDRIDEKIYSLYKANKFFYQSNDVGEIVRNFVNNAKGGLL